MHTGIHGSNPQTIEVLLKLKRDEIQIAEALLDHAMSSFLGSCFIEACLKAGEIHPDIAAYYRSGPISLSKVCNRDW